jgi:hypothetical protein
MRPPHIYVGTSANPPLLASNQTLGLSVSIADRQRRHRRKRGGDPERRREDEGRRSDSTRNADVARRGG